MTHNSRPAPSGMTPWDQLGRLAELADRPNAIAALTELHTLATVTR